MTRTIESVSLAARVAMEAHDGQTRRDGVTPYLNHVEGVVLNLRDPSVDELSVAWLHDTVEDTEMTLDLLGKLFPARVVEAVDAISKRKGESNADYIARVKANPIARKVKLADIEHNLSDAPSPHQLKKYELALRALSSSS